MTNFDERTGGPDFPAMLRADALASGLTRSQLESRKRHRRAARGLWVPSEQPDDLWSRCHALRLVLPKDAVFSHYTAGALLGVAVPDEPLIHICTEQEIEPRIQNVVGHRIKTLGDAHVTSTRGLPTTTPGRTYLDLASRLDLLSLVIAGDGLARRDPAGVPGLTSAVRDGTGRRGVKLARAGLPLLNPAAKSPGETRLRFLIVSGGLRNFLVNQPVFDENGEWIAEPDIQFPEIKYALEYEGDHHRERRQWELDIRRDENMRGLDWLVLKVTSTDLLIRSAATLTRILDAYYSRAPRR